MRRGSGFTLIEMALVLVIMALLLGSLLVPLSTRVEQQKIRETEGALEEAKEALIGYALSQMSPHLPCPDKTSPGGAGTENDGIEDFDALTGLCAVAEGNFPWVTLGASNTDSWGTRFFYSVNDDFSRRNPAATFNLASLGTLRVCQTSACVAPLLTNSAPAVIVSRGKNLGNCGAPLCPDEAENADGDNDFVSRTIAATGVAGGEFDDIVTWLSASILFNRLVAAGKIP
jgi:prepilin-type N-terminal cleavage/methylation domain-containing protein